MGELIGIREAARRLGVSDTAVHKAIKGGRVTIDGRTEKSNRPLVIWEKIESDWRANTEPSLSRYVPKIEPKPEIVEPEPIVQKEPPPIIEKKEPIVIDIPQEEQSPPPENIGEASFAESRALREAYQAELARLDYEERSGKLMDVEKVKASAFKMARTLRDGMLNLPDRVAHELAHETDANLIHVRLTEEIRSVLGALS